MTKICCNLIYPPSTPDFLDEVGLNLGQRHGYFLLQLSDCMMEIYMRLPMSTGDPSKSNLVGRGLYKICLYYWLRDYDVNKLFSSKVLIMNAPYLPTYLPRQVDEKCPLSLRCEWSLQLKKDLIVL